MEGHIVPLQSAMGQSVPRSRSPSSLRASNLRLPLNIFVREDKIMNCFPMCHGQKANRFTRLKRFVRISHYQSVAPER